jgi:hypothetical protein
MWSLVLRRSVLRRLKSARVSFVRFVCVDPDGVRLPPVLDLAERERLYRLSSGRLRCPGGAELLAAGAIAVAGLDVFEPAVLVGDGRGEPKFWRWQGGGGPLSGSSDQRVAVLADLISRLRGGPEWGH